MINSENKSNTSEEGDFMAEETLSSIQKDTLAEIGNISLGSAATTLSTLLNNRVDITTPKVSITSMQELMTKHPDPSVVTTVAYSEGIGGENVLIIKERDAIVIAKLMMGETEIDENDLGELDEIKLSAVSEAMNQMMGTASTSMSTMFDRKIDISPPKVERQNLSQDPAAVSALDGDKNLVEVAFRLVVGDLLDSELVQLIPIKFAKEMTSALLPDDYEEEEVDEEVKEDVPPANDENIQEESLTDIEKDTLAEIGNISLGSAATTLSTLVSSRVDITTPKVTVTSMQEVMSGYPTPSVVTTVAYSEGLGGENVLIIDERDASVIAKLMMGETEIDENDLGELDEIKISAVSEAMNQMMGTASTSMSTMFDRKIDISPPKVKHQNLSEDADAIEALEGEKNLVQIAFRMVIGDLVDSELIQLIPIKFAKEMVSFLMPGYEEEEVKAPAIEEPEEEAPQILGEGELLTPIQKDTLSEVGNISLGSAATTLSTLLNRRVDITTPTVSITTLGEIKKNYPLPCVIVNVAYSLGLNGDNVLIIAERDAAIIAHLMMGEEVTKDQEFGELNEIHISAVSESMNQMMGTASTSMSTMFARTIDISPPVVEYKNFSQQEENIEALESDSQALVQISFKIVVDDLIDSELIQLIPLEFAKEIADFLITGYMPGDGPPKEEEEEESSISFEMEEEEQPVQEGEDDDLAAMLLGADKEKEVEKKPPAPVTEQPQVQSIPEPGLGDVSLDLLKDIDIQLIAVLGKTKLPLNRVLKLSPGSLVELENIEGEPIDVLANGKLVARAEIVAVSGQYGLKISKMLHKIPSHRSNEAS